MRISLVIPIYNEADRIARCLRAIANQTVMPYEVIVVDNNSTDNSLDIVRMFPFVAVIAEPRQGVVYARDAGFDVARGDIIGRIDADTLIAPNWIETVVHIFKDKNTDAITGKMHYSETLCRRLVDGTDLVVRRWLAKKLGREVAIQGANMAFRRSAWQAIRTDICHKAGIHEDFDLAIHLNRSGFMVRFDERLEATIGFRQLEASYLDFIEYVLISPKTYAYHQLRSRFYMYPVVVFVLMMYYPFRLLHCFYDAETGQASLRAAFLATNHSRVNPATYVE